MEKDKKANAAKPTYEELEQQVKHLTKSLCGAKGGNSFLRSELKAEQQNVEDLRKVLQEAKSDMTVLQKYNDELKAENSRLQRAVEANEAYISQLKINIEEMNEQIDRLRQPWWKRIF